MRAILDLYMDEIENVSINHQKAPNGRKCHELYLQLGDMEFSLWFRTAEGMKHLAKMLLVHAAKHEEEEARRAEMAGLVRKVVNE